MSIDRYYFRTRIHSASPPHVRDEVDSQIAAFWRDQGDPDGWYVPIGIVTQQGRIVGIIPEEESRKDLGGDGTHLWAGIPRSRRWAWTELQALRAVAEDLHLFRDRQDREQARRHLEALDFDALLDAVHEEVPERIAQAYRKMVVTLPRRRGNSRQAEIEFRAFRIAEGYRLLRQAAVPPFTDEVASIHAYRAFDLQGEGANAIAVVNIHT